MTLGKGATYATTTRQKINATSSTEAETVAVHEVLPQILWTRYFLQAQGYGVEEAIIYQDNQSAILLAKNGRGLSSKRTRHINIRYFFVADRIASKEVKVEYCPTGDMIADYFTKPLQGSLFKKFRDFIMNGDPSSTMTNGLKDRRSVLEQAPSHDGTRSEEETWTLVGHEQNKKRRHRRIRKGMREVQEGRRTD